MVPLISGLRADHVRANLERVREQLDTAAGPGRVQILAAIKYLAAGELPVLAQAGIELVGENRAQELIAKQEGIAEAFVWDFIGQLQSRKVKDLIGRVRYIHSVASDSVLRQLERHGDDATRVLVEVNVAGEAGKGGIIPEALPDFLQSCPVPVVGLMTMPPSVLDPEENRPHFAALRRLAERHDLPELSMGTSQDYLVAAQEGATIVRLGTILYSGPQPHQSTV